METKPEALRRAIRAAARGAEAIGTLPAVPTQQWTDEAARALFAPETTSIVAVMFARIDPSGAPVRVESAGIAGATMAEVATNVGRFHAAAGPVPLAPDHPGLEQLRSAVLTSRNLGWTPVPILESDHAAVTAAEYMRTNGAAGGDASLAGRWSAVGVGPVEVVLGAAWLGSSVHRRAVLVEMGLAAGEPYSADEAAAVLDELVPALARRAALAFDPSQPPEIQALTTREEMVLRRLLEGKSVRLIAEELERSPHTVHDHVKSLHRKLNATTRGALVARALGHIRPDQPPEPTEGSRSVEPAPSASEETGSPPT